MENLQYEEIRHNAMECCPNIAEMEEVVTGCREEGCCGITPIMVEKSALTFEDSVEDGRRKTGFMQKALRFIKKINLRDFSQHAKGKNRLNTDQLALESRLKYLKRNPSMRSEYSPLFNSIDSLTQFTNIYPMFYR